MNADPFFIWLEATPLSVWIRESPSLLSIPGILTAHTLAMGFLTGTTLVIALRLLGFAPAIPRHALERLFPVLWLSFWVNFVTGILLVIGYPTKALTNGFFYGKLAIVAAGVALIPRLRQAVVTRQQARPTLLAITSVLLWTAALTFGRLLPYTYHRLLALE